MREKISGFAFHCHHDKLFEWVYDYDERVDAIKKYKPKKEQSLRLKLFQMIPEDRLPIKLVKARAAYIKAIAAYNKAIAAHNKAIAAYDKAGAAYDKAGAAYDKAWEACEPDMIKLHKELCPDCPWDGKTIFPKRKIK